jgi:glycosyltransferase involved in cell wall biosynthesis
MPALQAKSGPTIEFMGRVDDTELPGMLARAKAFIMPGEEDFGIAPVEANACGRPVLAYAAGGALDTQIDNVTGVLFDEQSVDGLCDAVCRADHIDFDPIRIRAHASRFDTEVFRSDIARAIAEVHPTIGHRQVRGFPRIHRVGAAK